jgi:pimeloyl-ACP methyl ester carboxylesterase
VIPEQYINRCTRLVRGAGIDWLGRWENVNGELVHLVEAGEGEPLLLIHGFLVWSYFWRKTIARLSSVARVIAPDLRGFGLTERQLGRPLSLWAQADLLASLMDRLSITRAVLCGHSMGGEVALRFALRYPERVRGLILVSSAGYVRRDASRWERLILQTPAIRRLVMRALLINRRYAGRALREAYYRQEMDPIDLTAYLLPARLPATSRTMAQMLLEVDFGAVAGELDRVRQPTLLLWGKDDPWIPLAHGERLATVLPNARLTVIPECGHAPPEEHPDAFAREVTAFWRALD